MLRNIFGYYLNIAFMLVAAWTIPASFLQSATLECVQQFGTIADDAASAIAADRLGNVYVGGSTGGDLGGLRSGTKDVFLSKFDSAGQLQWSKQFGARYRESICYGLSADGLGNIYVAGTIFNSNGFLNKFDAAGNMEWSRQIESTASNFVRGVSADGLGNVYITGNKNVGGNFLAKYDAAGNLQWEQILGPPSYAVSADQLGNVFVTGRSVNNVFVKKFDAAGTLNWTKTFGIRASNIGTSASADGLGNIYVAGVSYSYGGTTFAPFVSKLDEFGVTEWTRELNLKYVYGESLLNQTTYLFNDPSITVSTGVNGAVYTSESGDLARFESVKKFDAAGNLQWTQSISSPDFEVNFVVANDGMGTAYIAGLTAGNLAGTNVGGQDAFVAKFSDPAVPEPTTWHLLACFCMVPLYRHRPV
jgi:hypothetical protein